jgi:hypothetical protein
MGKNSTFSRELPEKSTRGHTDFFLELSRQHVLKLCAKFKNIKNTLFEISTDV